MKKFSKLFGVVIALALMFTTGVKAEDDFDYAPDDEATGTETQLVKYLVMDENVNVPEVTFTYEVSAGAAIEADDGTLPVYAGINPGDVVVDDAEFTTADTATAANATEADSTLTDKIAAKKELTVDFSEITFPKPGVYRYLITEQDNTTPGIVMDAEPVKTVDVYIIDNDGTLEVQGYVVYDGEITAEAEQAGTDLGDKDDKYINEFITNELTVEKIISGNQGDKESKWNIKVTFETLPNGYNVKCALIVDNGTDVPEDEQVWTDYTSGTALEYGHLYKYKFVGIPETVKYTVEEEDADKEGYTTTYTNEEKTFADNDQCDLEEASVENNRQGVIPTGVLVSMIPGAILVGGAAVYFLTRKKEDED